MHSFYLYAKAKFTQLALCTMKHLLVIFILSCMLGQARAQVVFTEDFSTATIASYDAIGDFKSAALCNGYINTVNNTCGFNTITGGIGGTTDKFLFNGTKAGGNYIGEFWGTLAANVPVVQPNTTYIISFWINANQVRPPAIDVFINADSVGRIVPVSANGNWQWAQYSLVWYSGSASLADISLVNKNNESLGCDWGLDQITLTQVATINCSASLTGNNIMQNASLENYSTCPNLANTGSAATAANWNTTGGAAGTGAQLMVNNSISGCISPRPQASWNLNNNLPAGAQGTVWLGLASTEDAQNTLATPTEPGAIYEFTMQAQCAKSGPNYVGESGTISIYGIKTGEADFLRKHFLGNAIVSPDLNLYPTINDWHTTTVSLAITEAYDRLLLVANTATDGNAQFYAYIDNCSMVKVANTPCQQSCTQNAGLINLISNASYETFSGCPTLGSYSTLNTATNWLTSGVGTGAQLLVNNGICISARPAPSWNTLNNMPAGSQGSAWLGLASGKDAQNTLVQSLYAHKYYELSFDATMAKLTPSYNGDNGTISIYGIKNGEPDFTKTHFLGKAIVDADGILFPEKWQSFKAVFKTTDVFDRLYFIADNAIDGNSAAYYYLDNLQLIEQNLKGCLDFGDAPNIYKTLLAINGASHAVQNNRLLLGNTLNIETDGQPDSTAAFDTSDDGLVSNFKVLTTSSTTYTITIKGENTTAKTAYVCGFIDFNADGDFNDVGEKSTVLTIANNVTTNLNLTFNGFVPLITKSIYVRVRISTDSMSAATSYGSAPDGEVEDYIIPPQHTPVVNDSIITTPEDVPISFCTTIIDIDAAPHLLNTLKAPSHGSYSLTYSAGQACIIYASGLNYFGTDTLIFTTCDTTGLCDTTIIAFNITPVPDPPVASNTKTTTNESAIVTVCAAIIDPEGGPFTSVLLPCTQHGTATTTVTAGNTYCITYTPDFYFSGTDSVCVIICDNTSLCDTAYVAITVNAIAHLQSDVNATFVNVNISGDISTNDKLVAGNS
jgi:GEVED domain/Bacterial Ig domain